MHFIVLNMVWKRRIMRSGAADDNDCSTDGH